MTDTATPDAPVFNASPGRPGRKIPLGQDLGLFVVLAALIVGFSIASPHFLTPSNLTNVLQSVAIIGVMAAVMTLVLVAGALDLSVGSVAALAGLVSAMLIVSGWNPIVAFVVALVCAAAAGALNGVAVVGLRINPIIVTIGTLSLFRGLSFVISDGRDITVLDPVSEGIAFQRWLFLPISVWVMLAVFAIVWWFARFTIGGRAVYAVGANPRAARLAGLPVERTRFVVMVASGLTAGVAGILLNAQSGSAVPGAASGYELQVLTAVLIGGTSLVGGSGRVTMTLVGVLIIGIINNGMTLLSVPSYYQTIAGGALLVLAVALDQFRRGVGYR
jgi:ribose transport system permease protein